jgi:lipoprotein-releasing system permease protein
LYLTFAWRYFKAKKSANAINIIAWVTTAVIAFATCCQLLVLSVYNGFEGMVKSLYADFYSDCLIKPTSGKTITLSPQIIAAIKNKPYISSISLVAEEKALLKNNEQQTVVTLKGVDENYPLINNIKNKITLGTYSLGTLESPNVLVGFGIQNKAGISVSELLPSSSVTLILPKKTSSSTIDDAMSEGNCLATGVFTIQQEIDEKYVITNLAFIKNHLGFEADEYTAVEIKLKKNTSIDIAQKDLQQTLGANFIIQTRFEQNSTLYNTLRMEKWVIYAVLTLILIIASFNMISALSMLVLEKTKDIAILKSMGVTNSGIQKIFLSEGLLLGVIGAGTGILLALIISFVQIKFHLIKITGGTFLIDYFPVRLIFSDFIIVAFSSVAIAFIASWYPSKRAAEKQILLK